MILRGAAVIEDKLDAKPLTAYHLKLIAVVTMLIDHVGLALLPQVTFLRIIGRIAFPIFAFLIAEGCRYTSSRWKYALRLGLFTLISQVPYVLGLYPDNFPKGILWQLNIFYTLFLAVAFIHIFETLRHSSRKTQLFAIGAEPVCCGVIVALVYARRAVNASGDLVMGTIMQWVVSIIPLLYVPVLLWWCHHLEQHQDGGNIEPSWFSNILAVIALLFPLLMASLLGVDYGIFGVVLIFALYLAKSRKMQAVVLAAGMFYHYGWQRLVPYFQGSSTRSLAYLLAQLAVSLVPVALVYVLYNGKRGKPMKWPFYIFYPAHLAVIAGLRIVLGL